MCFRPRPLKCFWRLKAGTDHSSFILPFVGWWRVTACGGGGGSGATHISYGDPSESGSNGANRNVQSFKMQITGSVYVGEGGTGGVVTNDLNFPPQRGSAGENTTTGVSGVSTATGGSGGRCTAEASGLNPTQPAHSYTYWSGTGTTRTGVLFGVYQDGGAVRAASSDNAGQGAAGRAAPPPANNGFTGSHGQIDFRLEG